MITSTSHVRMHTFHITESYIIREQHQNDNLRLNEQKKIFQISFRCRVSYTVISNKIGNVNVTYEMRLQCERIGSNLFFRFLFSLNFSFLLSNKRFLMNASSFHFSFLFIFFPSLVFIYFIFYQKVFFFFLLFIISSLHFRLFHVLICE